MLLEKERGYFESHRDDLLKTHEDAFVLVKGEELIGVYRDAETAYADGLARFGIEPFLVRQVLRDEPVVFVPMLSI